MIRYRVNNKIQFNCGFHLTPNDVVEAICQANITLMNLPASLFRCIDYKTTSAMIGCVLCENIALTTKGQAIVNPIEKGTLT